MQKALSLSGGSLKGSTLSIEVSKKRAQSGRQDSFGSRGGFTSPRGGGFQGQNNRGELRCSL